MIFLLGSICILIGVSPAAGSTGFTGCNFTIGSYVPCGARNASRDVCTTLGCCYANTTDVANFNLTQNCMNTTVGRTSKEKRSTCLKHPGAVCFQYYANKTFHNSSFFIDLKYGINGTDEIMTEFMNVVSTSARKTYCKAVLPAGICQYAVPPCNADGMPIPICKEDCDELTWKCSDDIERILGAVEYIVKLKGINFSHLVVPDCNNLKYSNEYPSSKSATCRHTGLFEHFHQEPKGKISWPIIVAGTGAGLACLVLALILICIFCKHRKTKEKALPDVEFLSVYTTIRDRLRQDSAVADPLLQVLSRMSLHKEPLQYPLDRVEYIRDLGEGQFGIVFQGRIVVPKTKTDEETMVAVKVLKEGSSNETKEAFNQEVALMSALHHQNILRLLAVSTEEEPYCMIFEYMEYGDLNKFLRSNDPERKTAATNVERVVLNVADFVSIAHQVASGMEYLSSHHFVHRDLATRNCLVGENYAVKIADFGMSRDIYSSDYYRVAGEAMLPIRWMPPEAILYGKFTIESDVYSYGILLWEVFTYALQPYYGYSNEEVIEFIKKGVLLPRPALCPEPVYDVMLACWHREPERRFTFGEVVRKLKASMHSGPANEDELAIQRELYDVPRPVVDKAADQQEEFLKPNVGKDHAYFNIKKRSQALHEEERHEDDNNFSDEPCALLPAKIKSKEKTKEEPPGFANIAFNPDKATHDQEEHENYLVPRSTKKLPEPSPRFSPRSFKNRNTDTSDQNIGMPLPGEVNEILRKRYISSNDAKKIGSLTRSGTVDDKVETRERKRSYQPAIQPSPDFWAFHSAEVNAKPRSEGEKKLLQKVLSKRSFRPGKSAQNTNHGPADVNVPVSRQRSLTTQT